MAKFDKMRKRVVTRLGFEPLEARAMCALSPVHVVIPTTGVFGSTLEPDGSVEIYGVGNTETQRWTIGTDGRVLSDNESDPDVGQSSGSVIAISPGGNWKVGTTVSTVPGELGTLVAWQRGSSNIISVEMPEDMVRSPRQAQISDTGVVSFIVESAAGGQRSWVWSQAGGLTRLKSLYEIGGNATPGAIDAAAWAISADGRIVVGFSGYETVPTLPTMWVDGIATALPKGNAPGGMALSISADGRVIGGNSHDGTTIRPQIWVDGKLQQLTLPPDVSNNNHVAAVVSGVGGDPDAWAALGWDQGRLWIARSDGVVHPFSTYLPEEYGLSLSGYQQSRNLLVSDDALYVVTFEATYPPIIDCLYDCDNEIQPPTFAGHVLILPNDFQANTNDRFDVSGDHEIAPSDVLILINAISASGEGTLFSRPDLRLSFPKIDVNGDGQLTAMDALAVINYLNARSQADAGTNLAAEGEAAGVGAESQSDWMMRGLDEYFQELGGKRRG